MALHSRRGVSVVTVDLSPTRLLFFAATRSDLGMWITERFASNPPRIRMTPKTFKVSVVPSHAAVALAADLVKKLRKMEREYRAQPWVRNGGCPEVIALRHIDGITLVVPECPYCGQEHQHGVGGGFGYHGAGNYGHRVSHCCGAEFGAEWNRGYDLVSIGNRNQINERVG